MLTRIFQGTLVGMALLTAAPTVAGAQTLGAGISFLGDNGGPGVAVDYSKPFTPSRDGSLGWVLELGYNHNGDSNEFGGGASGSTVTFQGGVRLGGNAADKLTWHGQGLVGVRRSRVDFGSEICDGLGHNCSDGVNDNGAILTVGGALQYALSPMVGLRGQLDFPIALGDGGSTTRFSIMLAFKTAK